MKKLKSLFVLIMCAIVLNAPSAMAADEVYYDLGDGYKLYLKSEVCKVADCLDSGVDSDWYNYSTTSENVEGDSGAGQTLVVKPGDILTFRNTTSLYGETYLNPVYGVEFSDTSYLTIINRFQDGLDDVDGNGNEFVYSGDDNIYLNDNPGFEMIPEIGAITVKINANTPDGTIITENFYLVSPDDETRNLGLGAQKAMAAEGDSYLRSVVRILVSNPVPVTTTTTTLTQPGTTVAPLPTTGADTASQLPYLFLLVSVAVSYGSFKLISSAKR